MHLAKKAAQQQQQQLPPGETSTKPAKEIIQTEIERLRLDEYKNVVSSKHSNITCDEVDLSFVNFSDVLHFDIVVKIKIENPSSSSFATAAKRIDYRFIIEVPPTYPLAKINVQGLTVNRFEPQQQQQQNSASMSHNNNLYNQSLLASSSSFSSSSSSSSSSACNNNTIINQHAAAAEYLKYFVQMHGNNGSIASESSSLASLIAAVHRAVIEHEENSFENYEEQITHGMHVIRDYHFISEDKLVLGKGCSGVVRAGTYKGQKIAVKTYLYKQDKTDLPLLVQQANLLW